MKIAKLFFPGIYEDAYVYMGRLFILTERRTLLVYHLDKLVEVLERDSKSVPIPTYLFSRNDWLTSGQFKTLMKNMDISLTLCKAFDKVPQPYYEIGRGGFLLGEQDLAITDPVILDLLIYSGRLYLGATHGFYQVDMQWDEKGPISLGKPVKKIDARCLSASARYGTVNASCNEEGLFTFVDDFGWWEQGRSRAKQMLATQSCRTSWIGSDIVNYPSPDHLDLFKSNTQETKIKLEPEGKVLVQVDSDSLDLSYLLEDAQKNYHIVSGEIQYAFNSSNRLFLYTEAGNLHSIQLGRSENSLPQLGKERRSREPIGRILSINPTKFGPVIETNDLIALILDKSGEIVPLSDSGALMVRTFPRSKRLQNIVAIVEESGVFLVSLFDLIQTDDHHTSP